MSVPFGDLKKQHLALKTQIEEVIKDVIQSASFVRGRYVTEFEEDFGSLIGSNHCIGCGNGTDAIYIALKALGVGVGDEVITTAMTWIATSEAITRVGAQVVFADVDRDSFNLDVEDVEKKINPATKAIVVVHLYGQAADMTSIMEIARANNLCVVEDCAQAHLAEHKSQIVGTFGDFGTFSFYPSKNLGAIGDAGALVTNNEKLAERARRYANHGALNKHDHEVEGINSRLDGIQAAVLSIKLNYLREWNNKRQAIAARYTEGLDRVPEIQTPRIKPDCTHVFHLYVVSLKRRDELREALRMKEISTGIHYPKAVPFLGAYQHLNHQPSDFPIAANLQKSILSLPLYPEMSFEQVDYVLESTIECL